MDIMAHMHRFPGFFVLLPGKAIPKKLVGLAHSQECEGIKTWFKEQHIIFILISQFDSKVICILIQLVCVCLYVVCEKLYGIQDGHLEHVTWSLSFYKDVVMLYTRTKV